MAGSAIFSLVPLLLGLLDVFTGFVYGLTGLIFIVACATALIPDWRTKAQGLLETAKSEVAAAQQHKDSRKTPDAKASNNEEKK